MLAEVKTNKMKLQPTMKTDALVQEFNVTQWQTQTDKHTHIEKERER